MAEPANNPPGHKQGFEQARQDEFDIRNASERYNEALKKHCPDKNYNDESLNNAQLAENKMFRSEQQNLDGEIAAAKDPAVRQRLELRKQIESYEYHALRGDRIASLSETNTGRVNLPGRSIENDEADRQRKRAAEFREQATVLRKEYRELQTAPAPQPINDNSRERSPSVQTQAGRVPLRSESINERNSRIIKEQDFAARAKELTGRAANQERENDGPSRGRTRDRYGPER